MSATLPPVGNSEPASNLGEFWGHAQATQRPASIPPEEEFSRPALSSQQLARRARFRRAVAGLISALLAFTALATCLYVVKGRSSAHDAVTDAKPSPVPQSEPSHAPLASPAAITDPAIAAPPSDSDRALALARAPVATEASFRDWSRLAGQLSSVERQRAEHHLSRLSVTGARSVREAARLELALLWQATARRVKAHKVLLNLARSATDPVVKKYALSALSAA